MRIGLIIPGNYWFSPYVKIYEEILNERNLKYDIISWDRQGNDNVKVVSFKMNQSPHSPRFNKIIGFIRYRIFLIRVLNANQYDKLIVFGPQIGLLLFDYLIRKWHKRFILDYRDLSVDQIFKKLFDKLLNSAGLIAISSPGFKRVLPNTFDYLISHNLQGKYFDTNREQISPFQGNIIKVSTIGAIRDFDANMELVQSLGNDTRFLMTFKGQDSSVIQARSTAYDNIEYSGFYIKEEEQIFFLETDFINIYYPDLITHNTALSNRFYNALVFKRPMIVKSGSIQGELVEKYNLGLSITDCSYLGNKLVEYKRTFKYEEFKLNCSQLLQDFGSDYKVFKQEIVEFLEASLGQ